MSAITTVIDVVGTTSLASTPTKITTSLTITCKDGEVGVGVGAGRIRRVEIPIIGLFPVITYAVGEDGTLTGVSGPGSTEGEAAVVREYALASINIELSERSRGYTGW